MFPDTEKCKGVGIIAIQKDFGIMIIKLILQSGGAECITFDNDRGWFPLDFRGRGILPRLKKQRRQKKSDSRDQTQ
jgi:hypothetical protein